MQNLIAPKKRFRVVGVDTFDNDDWHAGDFKTIGAAKDKADQIAKGKQMTKAYVYNDKGACLYSQGSY